MPVYGQSIGYGHRKDVVADERTEHERVVVAGFAAQEMDALLDAFHREAAETGARRRHTEPVAEPYDEVARGVFARLEETAGHTDRAVEATTAEGRGEQREHRSATCRLAGDGDPARITAERRDVLPHPVEREQQVAQPEVRGYAVQRGEPVHAEPVAGRHGDDSVAGEGAAVVPRTGRAAREEAAAVDPHQHGAGLTVHGGDDTQVQYVVARHRRLRNGGRGEQRHALRGGAVPGGVERLCEPAAWHRRGEPPRTDGCFGERDAEEAPYPAGAAADDRAGGSLHHVHPLHRGHRIPVPATPCTK